MLIAVFGLSWLCGTQSPMLTFVDSRTNQVRKFAVPSSCIIEKFQVSPSAAEWKVDFSFVGSADPTKREPEVLECHFLKDGKTSAVLLFVIQGQIEPKGGTSLSRNEARLFMRSGKVEMVRPRIAKNGVAISIPGSIQVTSWWAVTRWRPLKLEERFSPSSLWQSTVSQKSSESTLMSEAPSLDAFLRFEFGRGR